MSTNVDMMLKIRDKVRDLQEHTEDREFTVHMENDRMILRCTEVRSGKIYTPVRARTLEDFMMGVLTYVNGFLTGLLDERQRTNRKAGYRESNTTTVRQLEN